MASECIQTHGGEEGRVIASVGGGVDSGGVVGGVGRHALDRRGLQCLSV